MHARRKHFRNPALARRRLTVPRSFGQPWSSKESKQSAHGSGTAADCAVQRNRTFAAGHQKQARCARLGEGVGGALGLFCWKSKRAEASEAAYSSALQRRSSHRRCQPAPPFTRKVEAAKEASRKELWRVPSTSGAAMVSPQQQQQQRNGAARHHQEPGRARC